MELASDAEKLERCWRIVYEEYVTQGYMRPNRQGLRYTLHDGLPDTATFLVTENGRDVGTITAYPDSPLGLPADDVYREEVDRLRDSGRRPAEIGRLAIRPEYGKDRDVLMKTLEMPFLYARGVLRATDVVITVNPKHESFYRRMMLFDRAGNEQEMASVCRAPAVLLQIDLAWQRAVMDWVQGQGPRPSGLEDGVRTIYRSFLERDAEAHMVTRIRGTRRDPDEAMIGQYFVRERPLIPSLRSGLRYFFEKCYPRYDWARSGAVGG
jgi:hypothetical protein